MADTRRSLADHLEVRAPRLAALGAQLVGHLPVSFRRGILQSAFDRARDAFNRGDLEVVFALFASDVEYGPPPPLYGDGLLRGRTAVLDFWQGVLARFDDNMIENLSLEEASPGRIVRRARLRHCSRASGEALDYVIVQTTELRGGQVVRQINVFDHAVA